jgi:hypothetical protein
MLIYAHCSLCWNNNLTYNAQKGVVKNKKLCFWSATNYVQGRVSIFVIVRTRLRDLKVSWRPFSVVCCVHSGRDWPICHMCLLSTLSGWYLLVEAVRTCVTSVNLYQTTRCSLLEDSRLYTHLHENLWSQTSNRKCQLNCHIIIIKTAS